MFVNQSTVTFIKSALFVFQDCKCKNSSSKQYPSYNVMGSDGFDEIHMNVSFFSSYLDSAVSASLINVHQKMNEVVILNAMSLLVNLF